MVGDRRSLVLLVVVLAGTPVFAQQPAPRDGAGTVPTIGEAPENIPATQSVDTAGATKAEAADKVDDREAKERAVSAGILVLLGITIAGMGMVLLVMIWGRRVRRISLRSSGKTAPADPFWYLRAKPRQPDGPSGRTGERPEPHQPESPDS